LLLIRLTALFRAVFILKTRSARRMKSVSSEGEPSLSALSVASVSDVECAHSGFLWVAHECVARGV